MHGKISHMEIEKRNAWQNKPHTKSKNVNKVRMKIDKRNAWQNKLHKKSDNNK